VNVPQKLKTFAFAYIKTMRLYYAFITGIAGWIGVSFYQFLALRDFHHEMTTQDYHRSVLIPDSISDRDAFRSHVVAAMKGIPGNNPQVYLEQSVR